ncbi:MAG TPA: serine/threonine protein kinase [Polyangiaceae bacterium]|nr:serine/threonine protein kinase [Polyangiaceae bacterium]
MTRALASPYGILIVFPSIVLAVGLLVTLVGQRALKGSNLSLGERRLGDQAQLVASHLRGALEQANPMLDQLASFALGHGPDKPIEPAAAVLLDVMNGRAGVAYASISFPDGTFQGTYVDKDGALRFQDSRVKSSGTLVRRYDYVGHERLALYRDEITQYDPRLRDFYRLSTEASGRVWTKPYPFYGTHYTGVTRTAPVYRQVDGQRQLHAVLTVDFDVSELSRYLRHGQLSDMRTLLFTADGTLLAFPQGEKRIQELPLREDRALGYRDLKDATLDSFFGALARPGMAHSELLRFEAGGVTYLSALAKVSEDASLDWRVAYFVPERVLFESLHNYGRRSFGIAAIAVLAALWVAVAFARLITRARREVAEAKAEAHRANQAARELGSYRLIKCLGKGGMGEVWRAEHRLLAREAAIKLIRLDSKTSSAEAQTRFRREAQSLAALRSRNTIELFDYGVSDDGTFFYVMELLDGLDLESLVVKYGPQPPGRVLRLLLQACRSLAEAHDVGLVHRDIKPANLFVCRAADEVDLIKVLDFGLVRALSEGDAAAPLSTQAVAESTGVASETALDAKLTRAGTVMGTPEFMAPEQALGHDLDGRADVYALGCVGYWLLTGRLLFNKPTAMLWLLAHIQESPISLDEAAPKSVPPALKLAILDSLNKKPEQRPSARELWRKLADAERELAPQQVWTDEQAQAWWRQHQPQTKPSMPSGLTPSPASLLRIADAPQRH